MKGINQYVKDNLRYDCLTGRLTWKTPCRGRVLGGDAGSEGDGGYIRVTIRGRSVPAHRICWFLHYGEWPERDIDHKNRRPNDNRMQNLRLATKMENARNRTSARGSSSKYLGVRMDGNRWEGAVKAGDKYETRYFDTELAAALWRDMKAREWHGAFASLNFPDIDVAEAVKKIKAA
jgi:hypothetical protein